MVLSIFIVGFLAIIGWICYGGEEWVRDRISGGSWIWKALALIIAVTLFLAPFVPRAVQEVNKDMIDREVDQGP